MTALEHEVRRLIENATKRFEQAERAIGIGASRLSTREMVIYEYGNADGELAVYLWVLEELLKEEES